MTVIESILYGKRYQTLSERDKKASRGGWWAGARVAMLIWLPVYLAIGFVALVFIRLR